MPGRLPLCYFAYAHLCLGLACAEIALEPAKVAGFFYHPRMIAVVHLVTLGWISASILGALHLVGPMALRAPMPARRSDFVAFAAFVLGSAGIISHFWLEEFSGVAWSGLVVMLAFAHVGAKTLRALWTAKLPPEVKLPFFLAFANVVAAALAGTLLGLNKHWPFLPGHALSNAYAHAHLAALGWATMMIFAVGHRLLPMLLPAAMPRAGRIVGAVLLLEVGTVGIFVCLIARSPGLGPFAVCAVAGILAFLATCRWMTRHRRPPPKALIRPDFGVLQTAQALAYLVLTAVLGLILAFSPTTEWTLRLAAVYGVCGLLGFLSQMVVGVGARLLPIYGWFLAAGATPGQSSGAPPPGPHATPDRRLQAATLLLWTLGVPILAAGFYLDRVELLGLGGWLLLGAVAAGAASHVVALRAARR